MTAATGPHLTAHGHLRIELPDDQWLVGDHVEGRRPGYLFLHGLGSARAGEKSESLLDWAARRGRAFTRCDFRGHGESSGTIGQVTIGELVTDTVRLLEHTAPVTVVGSSMGGLVGAFAAARRPDLVAALVLIAPAFGFLQRLERSVDEAGRMRTSDGRTFTLAQRVIDDARVFDERTLPRQLSVPTLVVHGDADEVVPHSRSERFFERLSGPRKELWVVPGGDHRLGDVAEAIWRRADGLLE